MKIGKRDRASVIFDNWCNIGVLQNVLTYRDMYNAIIKPEIIVKDILWNGMCNSPKQWLDKYVELSLCHDIRLDGNKEDELVWKSRKGKEGKNIVRQAYDDLKRDYDENKLATQDKVRNWGSYDLMMCPLCNQDTDSHKHLFFECKYAEKARLYCKCVRHERNNRIFKDDKRSPKVLAESLYDIMRMGLMSLKVKMSKAVLKAQMGLSCFMVPLKNLLQYGMMKDRTVASMALFCLVRDVLV
ncbi:reverse transcriptase zinc-binding domain-containing protein [Tanacetum coccineum]